MEIVVAEIRKTIGAFIGITVTWAYTALADDSIDKLEILGLIGIVGTTFGVWRVPNAVRSRARKRGGN